MLSEANRCDLKPHRLLEGLGESYAGSVPPEAVAQAFNDRHRYAAAMAMAHELERTSCLTIPGLTQAASLSLDLAAISAASRFATTRRCPAATVFVPSLLPRTAYTAITTTAS